MGLIKSASVTCSLLVAFSAPTVLTAQELPGYLQRSNEFIAENFHIIDSSGWFEALPGSDIPFSSFITEYKQHFGMGPDDGFVLRRTTNDDYPFLAEERRLTHHRYQQTYKGLRVEFAELFLHHRNDRIEFINCKLAPGLNLPVTPSLNEEQALNVAIEYFGTHHTYTWQDEDYEAGYKEEQEDPNATSYPLGELLLAKDADNYSFAPEQFTLAWKFSLMALDTAINHTIYIDAHTGEILRFHSNVRAGTTNLSYNYGNGAYIDTWWRSGTYQHHVLRCDDANGPRVWTKKARYNGSNLKQFGSFNCIAPTNYDCTPNSFDADDNWADAQLTTPHWAAMKSWDYFKEKFNRNGYDGKGSELRILAGLNDETAAYSTDKNIIFLGTHSNGKHQGARDQVAHEFTHGVTASTANLVGWTEFGALDESFSDIFAYEVERYTNGGVHVNWEIGEDVELQRKMNNPSQSPVSICAGHMQAQPSVYKGARWYIGKWNNCDAGGIHINSGVQNYWFYLLSEGSAGAPDGTYQDIPVQGITADKAAQITFYNLDNVIGQYSYYADSRLGSLFAARVLFGSCSNELQQTYAAWAAVGIGDPMSRLSITGPKYIWYKKEPGGTITIKGGMPKDYIASGGGLRNGKYSWTCSAPWTWAAINNQPGKKRYETFRVFDFNSYLSQTVLTVDDGCNTAEKKVYFLDYGAEQVVLGVVPNPVSGMLRVEGEFPAEGGDAPVFIIISDGSGNIGYEGSFETLPATIYLSDIMPPGNYYLSASKGEYVGYAQFMKQ